MLFFYILFKDVFYSLYLEADSMTTLHTLRATTLTTLLGLAVAGLSSMSAMAQIQSLDVKMASSQGIDQIVLEPLTFSEPGNIDPRQKVERKPFIGTLIFERDQLVRQLANGAQVVDTTTSSCALTAAYDPDKLLSGNYDVEGISSDHCITKEGKIGFDRAIALFPGAKKSYLLGPAHFRSSGETSSSKMHYAFDWATVNLPEDPELFAVPLHKGDYNGEVIFEASTKGHVITASGRKADRYVATTQTCQIARRHQDYSSDKVTTCKTAKAMSGGGFFIPETGALYATLSRIGQESGYSYATLVSSIGQTYDAQYEDDFQVANYALKGVNPFDEVRSEKTYQVADVSVTARCIASDGSNLIDSLMLTGMSYKAAREFC